MAGDTGGLTWRAEECGPHVAPSVVLCPARKYGEWSDLLTAYNI